MRDRLFCKLERNAVIPLFVFVMLREFLQRADAVLVPATSQLREHLQRGMRTLQLLFQQRDIPQRTEQQPVRKPGVHCALK